MNFPRFSPRRQARGFTLIEVLISILVFSFGVLGAVGMQARVIQLSGQNANIARASMLADELASEMWTQQTVDVDLTANADANAFYLAWQSRVGDGTGSGLPSGVGSITKATDATTGATTATITITWQSAGSAVQDRFLTTVVVQ